MKDFQPKQASEVFFYFIDYVKAFDKVKHEIFPSSFGADSED